MGHITNKCIVVNGFDIAHVRRARKAVVAIFESYSLGGLVGNVTAHAINGGGAFLIAPDGSKVGWDHHERGEAARREAVAFLKNAAALYLEWTLLEIGGDDGRYCVLNSPNGADMEPAQ